MINPLDYIKIGIAVIVIAASNYLTYYVMDARYVSLQNDYATSLIEATSEKDRVEDVLQGAIDANNKQSKIEIVRINSNLTIALNSLRDRPDRPSPNTPSTGNPEGATGAELYRADAEFLTREAARAEGQREALDLCYRQYDKVKDEINALREKPK